MRKFMIPGLIFVAGAAFLAVIAIAIGGNSKSSIDSQVARGKYPVVPDARQPFPVLGSSVKESLSQYRGKVVLVNVFAGWCTTCYAEAPLLHKAQQELKASGGTVLGVTYQDSTSDAAGFVKKYGVDYPVLHDTSDTLSSALGVTGVPETFIVNRQGKIQALMRNELTSKWLNTNLPKILGKQS